MKSAVLYASYDGMLEPLGQSQVIAYLAKLSDAYAFHLVSFEKPRDLDRVAEVERMRDYLAENGIVWHPQRYHKRPPVLSAVWDLAVAAVVCRSIARRENVRLFHARNILCAAMLYSAMRSLGGKFLVDIRGFWADERVDGGMIAKGGLVYRTLKKIERAMLRAADHIVTLTEASVPILRDDPAFGHPKAPISVIQTCADLNLFSPGDGRPRPQQFIFGYVGQVGGWYLFDDMVALFLAVKARSPSAKMLIVNQHDHAIVRAAFEKAGMAEDDFELVAASREDVPGHVRRMTIGAALILPAFSKISSCPTKLAEYLGCGIPCVGNPGVGDVAETIESNRVGVVVRGKDDEARREAADHIFDLLDDPDLARRCRDTAERHFSLDAGVAKYRAIYGELTGPC
jgi:glycosyltransferase involved in cell wall biosynthesis